MPIGAGICGDRRTQQGAHDDIAAARLQHRGGAPGIVLLRQHGAALGHAAASQIGEAINDQARGFAARVGVDDLDAFHGCFSHAVDGSCREIYKKTLKTTGQVTLPCCFNSAAQENRPHQ